MTVTEKRKYKSIISLDKFRSAAEFKAAILKIKKRAYIDKIIALSEYDLIRAARARQWLNVPGQDFHSAIHFRDKVVMKSALERAGVAVPKFESVTNMGEVLDFIGRTKGPAILKARKASGSVGIWPLLSPEQVKQLPPDLFETPPRDRWMIETFIEGETYHVDGLIGGGTLCFATVSRYLYPSHKFSEGLPGGSYLISRDSELFQKLVAFAQACLAALPTPQTTTFHADIFRTAEGTLVAGEIACRTAGNRIREMIHISSGVDLDEALVRGQFVHDDELKVLAGWVGLRKYGGYVISSPAPLVVNWLLDPRFGAKVGDRLATSRSSVDNILTFIVTAPDEATLKQRLHLSLDWGKTTLDRCIAI